MDIYNKLPQDIQFRIDRILLNRHNKEYILPMIITKRSILLKKYINLRTLYLMNGIYYWLQLPPSNWEKYKRRVKYIQFFKRTLPNLPPLSYYCTLNKVYDYFKILKTGEEKRECIDLFLDSFTIEDLEDLLNYSIFTHYTTYINGVNKSPLALSTNIQYYNINENDNY